MKPARDPDSLLTIARAAGYFYVPDRKRIYGDALAPWRVECITEGRPCVLIRVLGSRTSELYAEAVDPGAPLPEKWVAEVLTAWRRHGNKSASVGNTHVRARLPAALALDAAADLVRLVRGRP